MARILFLAALLFSATFPVSAKAVQLLYDAEAINWLEEMAEPLLTAAGISPSDVPIRLIQDNDINAFVTPERDMYFHTGLILKADEPGEVLGVMAHEIGHIQGQHTSRIQDNLSKQRIPILIGGLVGVGAALAGSPDGAIAALQGGAHTARASVLYASRGYEEAADQTALKLLTEIDEPITPLIRFLSRLQGQELLYSRLPPRYLSTHPLTPERLATARHSIEGIEQPESKQDINKFKWIQAKIHAITQKPGTTLRLYSGQTDDASKLARAIAYARQGKREESQTLVLELMKTRPNDAYMYELLGHIALDHGRLNEAVAGFGKAVELAPDDYILRYQYGVAQRHAKQYVGAAQALHRVRVIKPEWLGVYKQLGLTYGAAGEYFISHLFLADYALRLGKQTDVKQQLALAEQYKDNAHEKWKAYFEALKTRLEELKK